MNPLAQIEDFRLGLIVEVTLDNLPDVINHPNFACGLIQQDDPNAGTIADALLEADVASMMVVTNANKLDLEVDGLLLDPVGFSMLDLSGDDRPDCEIAVLSPTRHQAMEAAENGADLLVFDATKPATDPTGEHPTEPRTGVQDALWWLEMMELPCALDLRKVENLPSLDDAPADFWVVNHAQITSHELISL